MRESRLRAARPLARVIARGQAPYRGVQAVARFLEGVAAYGHSPIGKPSMAKGTHGGDTYGHNTRGRPWRWRLLESPRPLTRATPAGRSSSPVMVELVGTTPMGRPPTGQVAMPGDSPHP
ncbi:hypothetical protein B296_00047604 [Ensete ventricosum]|uniref:Uncharacterized protein n=1 Tax=Ensete ventricosum TaxID=4639 RepID=A0A426XB34_ENSVE|nr:hypothetical protein B296_00047604 [Ensete ventricosum]